MEDIRNLYSNSPMPIGEMEAPQYVKPTVRLVFEELGTQEDIPMGAIIKSINKTVVVKEIKNGYLKCTSTETMYEYKEEGDEDMERGYNYRTEEVYFKEKPMDLIKMYL